MTRNEAITLLTACVLLAKKLAAEGFYIELTDYDRAALLGFNRVWLTDWLFDSDVHRQARLGREDIKNLSYMVARIETEELQQWQHDNDEQLDG